MSAIDPREPYGSSDMGLLEALGVPPGERSGGARWPVVFGALLGMHGIAHFVGLVAALDTLEDAGSLEYLGGAWVLSDPTAIRVVGGVWAVLGVAFAFAGVASMSGWRRIVRPVRMLATASTVMSVLALWAAWIGVVVNAMIFVMAGSSDRPIRERSRPPR